MVLKDLVATAIKEKLTGFEFLSLIMSYIHFGCIGVGELIVLDTELMYFFMVYHYVLKGDF